MDRAARIIEAMAKVRPSHYVVGIGGLALLRNWFRGQEVSTPRVETLADTIANIDRSPINIALEISELDVVEGYGAWAPVYDAPTNPLIIAEEPVVNALIDRMPAGIALDAACGTGRHTEYLRSRGHRVVAIDMAPAMLAKAREKVPGARFCLADLTNIPLAAASFDLAVCSLALDHAPELTRPIVELARVVRPDGWAIVSDFHPINRLFGGGAFFQGGDGNFGFVRSFYHDHAEYVSAFVAAGFEIRECAEPRWGEREIATMGVTSAAPETFREALSGLPLALVWLLRRR